MEYDEQKMIVQTVIKYNDHLLTQFEREVRLAFHFRFKARASHNLDYERQAGERRGNLGDPLIDAILEKGYEEYSRNVTERVMREQGDQVVLNRCPECNRIVRTPTAKQCQWCYHDWH